MSSKTQASKPHPYFAYRAKIAAWLSLPLEIRKEVIAIQLRANKEKAAVREAYLRSQRETRKKRK